MVTSPLAVLGLTPDILLDLSPDEVTVLVRGSYRRLGRIYHPDAAVARGRSVAESERKFREITAAYEAVMAPGALAAYLDDYLAEADDPLARLKREVGALTDEVRSSQDQLMSFIGALAGEMPACLTLSSARILLMDPLRSLGLPLYCCEVQVDAEGRLSVGALQESSRAVTVHDPALGFRWRADAEGWLHRSGSDQDEVLQLRAEQPARLLPGLRLVGTLVGFRQLTTTELVQHEVLLAEDDVTAPAEVANMLIARGVIERHLGRGYARNGVSAETFRALLPQLVPEPQIGGWLVAVRLDENRSSRFFVMGNVEAVAV